ncbi:NADPH:quinone reductase [Kalmusia sp. IMI 367209]|nr:NADPH:quinone reductase [Kalmusia sp. IMI 367209]
MASISIPGTMKGVQMKHIGGPEVLQYKTDLPVPVPGHGEVLVKNDFAGINYVDVYWRIGMMGVAPNGIIGREAEGTVVSTGPGSVDGLKVGDRVVWLSLGGYAEYTAVPSSSAYLVPSDVEPGVAAAALLQGLFSLTLVDKVAPVKEGDWVLVHAAAGGVGLWLCQLLKARGARTIGTASTAEKINLAKKNGADHVINYQEEKNLVKKIEEITEGHGIDIIYDGIGKDQTENNVNVVAKHGTIVTYGAAVIRISWFNLTRKVGRKESKICGAGRESAMMRNIGGEFHKWCAKLFDTMKTDKINVRIHDTYPLSEIRRIHEDLEGRKTIGKVLAKP